MLLSRLCYKWFGLEEVIPCVACEILRERLASSERERADLLHRLLDKPQAEPLFSKEKEDWKPITPQFIPWRVRQQMLEAEDKKRAQLMADKNHEIEKLEEELGVKNATQ